MGSSITWLSSQSKLIISRDLSEVALQGTMGRWWYILYSGLVMGKGALCVGGAGMYGQMDGGFGNNSFAADF